MTPLVQTSLLAQSFVFTSKTPPAHPPPEGGCVKSKHQVFFDILYKKGNALYLFILVFLLLSFGK